MAFGYGSPTLAAAQAYDRSNPMVTPAARQSWFDQNPPPGGSAQGTQGDFTRNPQAQAALQQAGGDLGKAQQILNSQGYPQSAFPGGAGPMGGGNGSAPPSFVNLSDPVQAFVWQQFQAKGAQPRDQGDFQYWIDFTNKLGGPTGANAQYITGKMQQQQGGIGDYGQGFQGGGQNGAGGGQYQGGPFSMPTLDEARNSPGYQFAQQQGMDAIQRSAAAKGTLLTGGTLKALQGYGTGLADQTYGNVFNRALQTNQTNYGNLYGLAQLGQSAATGAAS